ncbi:acylaminoacyl-peptidase, partial [mine drainage metagenome]
ERLLLDGTAYAIEWMQDDSILVLMNDPVTREVKEKQELGNDPIDYEADERFRSLYHYVPGNGFRKITNQLQVWEFASSPSCIIVVASDNPTEGSWYRSKLYRIDLSSGNSELLYDPKWRAIARPRISPDAKSVVFLESLMSDFSVFSGDIIQLDLIARKSQNITENSDRSYFDMHWSANSLRLLWGKECTTGIEERTGDKVAELWKAEGTVMNSWAPEFRILNGNLAFLYQDVKNPTELCLVDDRGKLSRITQENKKIAECDSLPAEVVKWKSSDGMEIYGIFRSAGEKSRL